MSPKSNKIFKKFPSEEGEQLDLVETINNVDKLRKKRLSIILFLLLTVGLSFSFWFYRQFQSFDIKKIKIPSLSFSKFSPEIPENWSVFVRSIGTTDFTYSSKFNSEANFNYIATLHDPPYTKKYLPDGVKVIEKINNNSEFLEIFSQISTPKNQFEIYTKIPGKINSDSPELDSFSQLVATFYWHLLK